MVAMPYILVNLVLESLALILFWVTSAALLSKYSFTNRYLPGVLRTPRATAFVAHGLVVLALSIAILLLIAKGRSVFIVAQSTIEFLCYIGLANSIVLIYQSLDGRILRNAPKLLRRLVSAVCAVAMTSAAAIVVFALAIKLFIIR